MEKKNKNITEFKMLHDNVLIKAIEAKTVPGLINPESYEYKPEYGEVISHGPGRVLENGLLMEVTIKKGDIVFFGKYSSVQTTDLGEDYYIIKNEDIVAVQ